MIPTSKTILNQKYVALNIVIYWFCALLVDFIITKVFGSLPWSAIPCNTWRKGTPCLYKGALSNQGNKFYTPSACCESCDELAVTVAHFEPGLPLGSSSM